MVIEVKNGGPRQAESVTTKPTQSEGTAGTQPAQEPNPLVDTTAALGDLREQELITYLVSEIERHDDLRSGELSMLAARLARRVDQALEQGLESATVADKLAALCERTHNLDIYQASLRYWEAMEPGQRSEKVVEQIKAGQNGWRAQYPTIAAQAHSIVLAG